MEISRDQSPANLLAAQGNGLTLILFFGSDSGHCTERAQTILAQQGLALSDSFRVSRLTGSQLQDDPSLLPTEASSLCFSGGRRLVWLTEVEERSGASAIQSYLKNPQGEGLIVVMAGELSSKSALRAAVKASPIALLVPCYPDGAREIEQLGKKLLAQDRITIDPDALKSLTELLGSDRMVTRSEIEKLALYAGQGGKLSQAEVLTLLGDSAAVSMNDAISAAAAGSFVKLDRAIQRVFAEGESAVAIIRSTMQYFLRLQNFVQLKDLGQSASAVVAAARPPVFWRDKDQMIDNVQFWSHKNIDRVMALLLRAEILTKSTAYPDQLVASQTLLQIAYIGRRSQSRS
ncbi:MAG: DNA polymerase III subunit delta [Candidatus Pacebacteria bacterium]|nr:DNA polymerase III subunit delta [Candidatus Paceibacterota bacterium]